MTTITAPSTTAWSWSHTPDSSMSIHNDKVSNGAVMERTGATITTGENSLSTSAAVRHDQVSLKNAMNMAPVECPVEVGSPLTEDGAFPSFTNGATSKREEIRRRLREKERALQKLITEKDIVQQSAGESSLDEESSQCGSIGVTKVVTYGKEDADRREAIRILSQSALQMTLKLKAQKAEFSAKQTELNIVISSLKKTVEEKLLAEENVRKLKDENETLHHQLAEIETTTPQREHVDNCEQLDRLEYELLVKNQEVEDLKQELNRRARRIIDLELDLETHSDRFLAVMDDASKVGSVEATLVTAEGEPGQVPSELLIDSAQFGLREKPKRSLRGIMSWRKKKGKDISSHGIPYVSEELSSPSPTVHRPSMDPKKLESRLREQRYQSETRISELQNENKEFSIKITSLERRLQSVLTKDDSVSISDVGQVNPECQENPSMKPVVGVLSPVHQQEPMPSKTRFLEEKVERLESLLALQETTIENLRTELKTIKEDAENEARRTEHIVTHCRLECDVYDLKLVALQRELQEMGQTGESYSSFTGLHVQGVAAMEAKLLEYLAEVVKLRKAQEIKDKKIADLRAKVLKLRYARMQSEKAFIRSASVADSISGEPQRFYASPPSPDSTK